jgi:alpha-tubulin suppressor-like RCC1 family protein
MMLNRTLARLASAATIVMGAASASHATFVQYFVVKSQVTTGGVLLDQYRVFARFNGPTDTVLNVFNLGYQGGATVADPYGAFWHKDNSDYNGGVLSKQYGTWAPTLTGSPTLNRSFDSFLVIGGTATATNTSNADPSWNSGGSGSHAGGPNGWNRADLLNNGTMGWFNSAPPNNQGRVGVSPNTATDVLLGQFVVDRDASVGTWTLTTGYNDGIAGSAVQFVTTTFSLCPNIQTYYPDADGDGFGNPSGASVSSCTPLAGYAPNNTDCNDANAAINPSTVWVRDLDGDGFGSTASGTLTQCAQPAGYVLNSGDCNDSDATLNPNTVWARDVDGDGFGSSAGGTLTQCAQPTGYVRNSTDCNDANAAINPNTVWSRDVDGDGFGSSGDGTLVQCAQPAGYTLAGGDNCPTIANPGQEDCNGNGIGNACEWLGVTLLDCDNDGIPNACEGGEVIVRTSPTLAPIGAGVPAVSHTFTGLKSAYGPNARLHIDAISDLDLSSEYLAISFDGAGQEFFFVAGGRDCPATPDRETKTFTIPAFNALVADGSLTVTITASGTVSPTQCANGGVTLRLEYEHLPSTQDCNSNGTLDSCELGTGTAFDCNGNGRLDVCDVAAGSGTDCNGNGKLDSCDLATGPSTDLDGNGVLDECAGEYVVGGSGYPTIQAAVDAVPSGGNVLLPPGVYQGPVIISGKRVNIAATSGPSDTFITGAGLTTSIVLINGAAASGSRIGYVTLQGGPIGYDLAGFRVGGAVAIVSAQSVTIDSCRFIDNHAGYGGALYAVSSSGIVTDCEFHLNDADVDGGALEFGGASPTSWQVVRCNIADNAAGMGGAMHVWESGVQITDTRFQDNSATGNGGAISWFSTNSLGVSLTRCFVEGNSGASGGGLAVIAGTGAFAVSDTRFCRNTPDAISGSYTNLGGIVFAQDCDGDGICDIDEFADAQGPSFVWSASSGGNGKRYIFVASPSTWERAKTRAEALGGNLATFTSAAENAAVAAQLGTNRGWIGGFQDPGTSEPNGGWRWVTGEPWSYTNWNPGEPNDFSGEDRLMMGLGGSWNDSGCPGACYFRQGFFVEVADAVLNLNKDCNGNGVADGCDISSGSATDCNGNNIPDSCDLASGTLADCNGNGTADVCELGKSFAWGENNFGQTSLPIQANYANDIQAGCNHAIALVDGSVVAWGSNSFGQTSVPTSAIRVRGIAAGCDHNVAFLDTGTVIAWGYNGFGQCNVPAAANGGVVQAAAGANHSGVRKANGSLVLWGRNTDGECNVPTGIGSVSKLALGGAHTMALRPDGTLLCWGLNNFGQCTIPAIGGAVIDIAAGCYHSVGLRSDGTVRAWGSNLFGQSTVPAGLTGVVQVAAGPSQHTLALKSNGTVVAWGWNAFGQATVPSNAVGIAQLSAGGTYSIARRGSSVDCNANGAVDSCEIASNASLDCNGNGTPDSCDARVPGADCDADGLLDSCEIASNTTLDCNGNGTLDSCDIAAGAPDCNGNGKPDSCEIASNNALDCNTNGALDSCELASGTAFDCNSNGRLDVCDVASGAGTDCNSNGKLDSCDLASGTSTDLNGNGVLDECPGEIVVGGSGYASIAAAINAVPSGSTVQVGPGTWSGAIVINSKQIGLQSIAGPATTILNGSGLDASIVAIRTLSASGSSISGFTFQNGPVGTAAFGARVGGAVLLEGVTASVTNCRFINNSSQFGGAIYAIASSATVENCVFEGNHASADAGAVQIGFGGNSFIRGNIFTNNSCDGNGGAVHVVQWQTGPVTIARVENCQFRQNSSLSDGEALSWYAASGGNLPVSGCVVESNGNGSAAFAKLSSNAVPSLAFAITNTRFCLNPGGNVTGPIIDGGGNLFGTDCNQNGLCDADEIANGSVADCDLNGLPDTCQFGVVVGWGEGTSGQTTVPSNAGFLREISAGCNHALGLRPNGTVVAWGANAFGQLGINGLTNVAAIAAGCDHSLAVRADGTVVAFGYNAFQQCNVPSAANGQVAQIAAGANHSGVRKNDGSLVLWGRNIDGECNVPAALGPAAKFALGGAHSVAMRADGAVLCWGLNNFGQCNVPANVGVLKSVAAGCYHTVGLRTNGTVVAWGSTLFGQTTVPAGLSNVVDISAGSGQHTLALKADGSVVAWGWNNFGQTTVPATAMDGQRIAAGGTFSMVRTRGSDDCDQNGVLDQCSIAGGQTPDCNANGTPDSCDIAAGAADCDADGIPDSCEIAANPAVDCNGNAILDSCDIASGTSSDLNANGKPDECAGEWIVGGTGFNSIAAALAAAPSGTTISVGPGTYTGTAVITAGGITLRSLGGAAVTTLSGTGATASILAARGSAANGALIEGFTFSGGTSGTSAFGVQVGGAIFFENVAANVRKCRFVGNAAGYGGAIYALNYSGTIESCQFEGNSASNDGGAAQFGFGGTCTFRGNSLVGNTAANVGGGLHIVYDAGAQLTSFVLQNTAFSGNSAGNNGGALSWLAESGAAMQVSGCNVLSNEAPDAAFSRLGGTLPFAVTNSYFCLNALENFRGDVSNLGGNTFSQDCNRNGVCDVDDIATGAATDCNSNGLPDSCELAGRLFAFGDDSLGQSTIPAISGVTQSIAAGCDHSLLLKRDGTLVAWGTDSFGEAQIPAGLSNVTAIAAGCDHNLALRADGTIAAWGYNAFGQCNVPTFSGTVTQIAAGANHSGLRKSDGGIMLWGRNTDGESSPPSGLGPVTMIALGGAHSAALRSDGTAVAWGLNNFGQCNVPANAGTLQSIALGCYHSVGLRTNGTVVAWGSTIFGQTAVPAGLNNVVAIASGAGQHSLALRSNGTVAAWGWNAFGQTSVPFSAQGIASIAAGGSHSLLHARPASDCNANGVLDSCELASGAASDCNGNGILDSCDLAAGNGTDCNGNGLPDSCDLASGAPDCNGNGLPDTCDLALGLSTDLNSNTIPDECAGEFVVGGSGYASIQAAINAAPDGTTIRVSNGTWAPISISGRQLNIVSLNGPATTIISGGNSGRVVSITNVAPRTLTLAGFTIRNGLSAIGAGVHLTNASPTIRNCLITENISTGVGGGVACSNSSALFEQCTISANLAANGGGIAIIGFAASGLPNQFDLCQVNGNDSSSTGAGTYNTGSLLLTGCEYLDNVAVGSGGGVFTAAGASSAIATSYFCLNKPTNTTGAFSDLGGNTFGEDCNSNGICDIDDIANGAEDKNQNGELDSCELARGDLNLDGIVNAADITVLLNFWGFANPPTGDLNGDGIVSAADLTTLLNNWGN